MDRWLAELREELLEGTDRPRAVKRVEIPKPGGGERPLGIPTIRDRVEFTNSLLESLEQCLKVGSFAEPFPIAVLPDVGDGDSACFQTRLERGEGFRDLASEREEAGVVVRALRRLSKTSGQFQ